MLGFKKNRDGGDIINTTWFVNFSTATLKPFSIVRRAPLATLACPAMTMFNLSPFKTQCRLYLCYFEDKYSGNFDAWIYKGTEDLKFILTDIVCDPVKSKGYDAITDLRIFKALISEDNLDTWDITDEIDRGTIREYFE